MIKAIGFDLDDTLYDRSISYKNVFDLMQARIKPLPVTYEEFYPRFEYYSNMEYESFIRGEKSEWDYKVQRVLSTYESFDHPIDREEAIIYTGLYLFFQENLVLRPGMVELLDRLRDQAVDLFILTNGPSDSQRKKIKQLGLDKWIDEKNWFISEELDATKPEADIFKKVERQIGHNGAEVLYIGDNYRNDIEGAHQVDWQSIYLNVHGEPSQGYEQAEVETVQEMATALKKVLQLI
ncbi:HAD family hydrolase [Hutsoniella sourekii]